ncbi:TIGR01244 family sulfur transferase [uncultured Cardiobacterium sp.]|uniref:TIGR01244 family sulfur transferase n=1 Tax=uncultured Cardiobacterium sp. TaxID=417619 RepID=UPI00262095FE|nr:TIGR01244 family sulfur transferase [uncultured Cardiobacterium sp.]
MQHLLHNLYVSGQIQPDELPLLRARGITQIICHRPDGEGATQPAFAAIAAAAAAEGIHTLHLPVKGGLFPPEVIAATHEALASGEPTLMFCKSGMRSTLAWALGAAAAGTPVDELVARAAACGYDLEPHRALLVAAAGESL